MRCVPPTAQTSVGEMAVTALSEPPPPEIVGVVWTLQDVPLKNSTSGPLVLSPTAQTALLDNALTPLSAPAADRGRGDLGPARPVEVLDQRSGRSLLPTAQMSVGETAETALKFDPVTVGLVTTWKPLERSWRDSS